MSGLSSHLHFAAPVASASSSSSARSPIPPAGSSLLVTDTLAASADFLLLHLVDAQLRRGRQVVFVGLGEAEGHWRALGKKLGTPLDSKFTFVDALSQTFAFSSPIIPAPSTSASTCPPVLQDDASLRPLFDVIQTALKGKARATDEGRAGGSGKESDVLLILEGLNSLAWSGAEVDDVCRLVRAIQHLSTKFAFASVLHLHTTPSTGALPTDDLFQMLHPMADLWIQVRGLASGRSADVSGELAFFPSPLMADDPAFPATQKGKELQYKLGDSSVEFFAKGTGRGFL